MRESPNPLSSSEMREQLRRFAEASNRSQAARSLRYEHGLDQPENPHIGTSEQSVPLQPSPLQSTDEWQCVRCGARLDGSQLKIYKSRFAYGGQDLAMCPHCGGAAKNLQQESIRQAEEFSQQVLRRKSNLRNGILIGAALALFLLKPSTWAYLLVWISLFWFGPLSEIHLKMRLGAVFVIMWAGFFGSFVIRVLEMNHLGKLLVWLLITVVIVAAGWMIEKVAALGGSLFYKG